MSTAGSASGGQHVADVWGRSSEVALQVDDDLGFAVGIELLQRLEDPVGAGGMVGAGHDGLAAMGCSTAAAIPACRWRPRPGRSRPLPRGAAHGRSSAGRRCRPAACRAAGSRPCGRGSAPRSGVAHRGRAGQPGGLVGLGRNSARLYGLPAHGQTDIHAVWGALRKPDSGLYHAAVGVALFDFRPGA